MGWEGIGAIAALCGVVFNFVRFGNWQGKIEAKVETLERDSSNALTKFDVINKTMKENNALLVEMQVKINLLFDNNSVDKHVER